ncbi:MAG: recombinase family protein, partial [Ruminococcus sp.]|nr:recombinase family protein [Ruminococcus sp.]
MFISRFGRNYVEAGQLIDDLFPLLNIRLVAPNDGVDTHTNQNTDFIPIRNVFNEYYCKDISRKVISARKASAKQGNFMGSSAPYGYWLDPNDRHMNGREIVSRYLKRKKGFILISHDRAILDECIDHVLSINRTNIEIEQGNYSSWERNKTARDNFEMVQNERLKK